MFQTYFVYGTTFLLMMLCAWFSQRRVSLKKHLSKESLGIEMILCIGIFTIVFGLRYDVGVDYLNYLNIYQFLDIDRFEPLFKWLVYVLSSNNIHYCFFFSILAFLQIYFFISAFKSEKYLYPALVYVLFCGQYFLLWMNVIRQDLAACIFIFSLTYIIQRKFYLYFIWCLVATCFHKSAILLLFLYPFLCTGRDYFKNRLISYILYFIALLFVFLQINLLSIFESELVNFVAFANLYEYAFMDFEDNFQARDFGFSLLSSVFVDILIIFYSKRLKDYYNTKKFILCYNLYMFGTIVNMLVLNSFLLARPFRYFRYFKLIAAAYLLYYLFKNGNVSNTIIYLILIFLFLLMFLAIPFYSPDSKLLYNFVF